MSLDGITIHALIDELGSSLIDGRISRIHQLSRHEIIIDVRQGGETLTLLGSINPNFPRAHLIREVPKRPNETPLFCMLLRKHLERGKIIAVEGEDLERLLRIRVESFDEFGKLTENVLIFEIMGRRSNIILINHENLIVDGMLHVTKAVNRYREILPGHRYIPPPPQEKKNPFGLTEQNFMGLMALGLDSTRVADFILDNIQGISPVISREILQRAGFPPKATFADMQVSDRPRLWKAFDSIMGILRSGNYSPTLFFDSKNIEAKCFSVFPLDQFSHLPKVSFESISSLLEAFYTEKATKARIKEELSALNRVVDSNLERAYKKLKAQKAEADNAKKAHEFRIKGELITANLYQMKKGQSKVTVVNYYDPDGKEVTFDLDPALSPAENAQKFFKKYTRARRGLAIIQEHMRSTKEEIEYLESVKLGLERAETISDLKEIRDELTEAGYIKTRSKKAKGATSSLPQKPMSFLSRDGWEILVGKSNRQNDHLTMKMAASEDYWFHVKDIPGSHVILRSQGNQGPSEETLYEAANLAAIYSKASDSTKVPVDYTRRKHVRKPPGAKPGMVIYEKYSTIFVTPDKELMEKLQNNPS
jgi:predicted ribosome quality control (RQC) complex YloA/Tae2 family protein